MMVPYQEWLHYLIFFSQPVTFKTEHVWAAQSRGLIDFGNRVVAESVVADAEVEAIKSYYTSRPFRWFVDERDHAQIATLERQGFYCAGAQSAMYLTLGSLAQTAYPHDLALKEVDSSEERAIWMAVVAENSHMHPVELAAIMQDVEGSPAGLVHLYLGIYNSIPVATALVLERGDTVTIHMVNTLEEYRGRGIGYAIVCHALMAMQEKGRQSAILSASGAGKSLYEKIGFKEYAVYRKYK